MHHRIKHAHAFGATEVEIRLMTVVKKEVIVVAKEDMLFSSTII